MSGTSTAPNTAEDPVCGMTIRRRDAVAREAHDAGAFYFGSHACHDAFLKDPHRYGHPTGD